MNAVSAHSISELLPPRIPPLVRFFSWLWLVPKREYLRRFRLGRTVRESVPGADLVVYPSVFNPVIFRTGKYFAEFLGRAHFAAGVAGGGTPRALDLGTGTGILAITAAQRGFSVDAVDVNPQAVQCASANVESNGLSGRVAVLEGDLFDPVAGSQYDLITFSPPSFRGEPDSEFDLCWRSADIFERFASELPAALKRHGVAFVLQTSHGDERGLIAALLRTGLAIEVAARKRFGVETLSIYQLQHTQE